MIKGDENMCTVTATEFKRQFGKYVELGQKEEIQVTLRGKVIFTIIPERLRLLQEWESIFDSLPNEAYEKFINKEISRE